MSNKTKNTATKEEATPALVPKLRFPEFRGAELWEDAPVDSILEVRDERQVPTTEVPLFSLTIENGITEKTDRYNREFLVRDAGSKKYKLVEPNDIVYNPSNLRWGAINYSQLSHSVVVSPIYEVLSLRDDSEHFLKFIACGVMRDEQIRRFITKGQGTLVERIAVKIEDFISTKLPVAPTRAEQQKIAECLSSVDELMAAQARKVDALKTHKKGLMQQLFPREGETQPRLRFPEFQNAEEWGVKPLGKAAENLDNRRRPITSSDREAGDVPYYGASGIVDYVEGFIFDEDLLCVSEDGANLVARTYPIAFPISGKTWVNNHAHVLRFANPCTQKFVEVYLNSIKLDDFITGMAQPKLNKAMLDKIPIPYPEVPEQQRIADCLTSLDDLIAAHTQKHEALKTHKKGLMQQLFPSPEEPTNL
jgi:type I restriction enzyme S subunit